MALRPAPRARPIATLVFALAIAPSCREPATTRPPVVYQSRAEDAARLPAFETGPSEAEPAEIERFYLELGDAPTRGPDDAPVTIVMFSDFECPFCQRGHQTLLRLEEKYRGEIRIAYKAFPLDNHSNALVAAMAARTAQAEGKFWEFHDLLFSQRGIDVDQLLAYAREVDLDLARLRRDLENLEYGPEVRRDMRQGRKLGVDSTPTFFINGRPLSGAQPMDVFEEIIEEELRLAEQWTRQGVPRGKLYEHAIKDGYRKVVYTDRGRRIDPDGVFPVPIGKSPTLGPADAPVTIVVFGDFQCPFCARGFRTLQSLRKHHGDKLRIVYKHQPLSFHSHAFIAARAAMAAHAQGKFWAYHDGLYALEARFDEDDLVELARKVGLNMKKFHRAMQSAELDPLIEQDQSLAAALGVTGTPVFFINGRPIEGAVPELQFRLLIEEELDRAAAALQRGVPRSDLYDVLTHEPLE